MRRRSGMTPVMASPRPEGHTMRMPRVACLVILLASVAYPFGVLLLEGARGLGAVAELWADPGLRAAAARTFCVSTAASMLAVCLGLLTGRLSARYRFPGRSLLRIAAAAPYVFSHTVLGVAWMLAADASSDAALTMITALALLPGAFLMCERLFSSMDSGYEEAARLCGASASRAFFEAELPLALPGLAACFVLCFLLSNGMLGLHAVIAWPSGKGTLTRVIYDALSIYPFDRPAAALVSCGLVALGAALLAGLVVLRAPASMSARFPRAPKRTLTGGDAAAAGVFTAALALVTLGIPIAALARRAAAAPQLFAFFDPVSARAFVHSLLLASGAAAACAAVGALSAWLGGAALGALCTLPYAFSGIVLGTVFILAFSGGPTPLHGTAVLLGLAYFVRELPLSYQSARVALGRLNPELCEQAAVCGASPGRAAREILWPLARPFVAAGAALGFMAAFREIEASVLLSGPRNEVFGSVIFEAFQKGDLSRLAGLALVGAAVSLAACAPVLAADRREHEDA